MTAKQRPGVYAPDGSLYITLTDGSGNLATSGGSGTVTSVSVTPANGVSGTVATATSTPAISLSLGNITPTTVAVGGATIGTDALAVTGTSTLGGTVTSGSSIYATNYLGIVGASNISGPAFGTVRLDTISASDSAITLQAYAGTYLTRPASTSATWQLGAADAASPVAQTLQFQNATGTNTAGVNATVVAPLATGTATPGDIVFQTGTVTGSGSTASTKTTALTIKGGTQVVTAAGELDAASLVPTGTTIPLNGLYLPNAGNPAISAGTTRVFFWNSSAMLANNTAGPQIQASAAGATSPVLIPNRGDATTGIGAQAAGNISLTAGATERVRIATGAASVSDILLPGTLFTGGTATTTFPQIFVQPTGTTAATTWSTSGTVFGVNAVSGFAGNFLDFHVAGGTSKLTVDQNGTITSSGSIGVVTGGFLTLRSTTTPISSPAAASVQLGATDAAVAVAQTLRVQSVVAGTAAANGANWTLIGSLPTGTGTSGDIIFQTGVKTGSGTTQGTATTALTIKGETQAVTIASGKSLVLGNAATTGLTAGVLSATTNASIVITDSTGQAYRIPCII